MEITLLQSENYLIRALAATEIKALVTACSGHESLRPTLTRVLQMLLLRLLPEANTYARRSECLFSLIQKVVEGVTLEDLTPLEAELW